MDFNLVDHQSAILDAVGTLLDRRAGPERMGELGGDSPTYDWDLDKALLSSGFSDVGRETGLLDAALVVEAVSARLGVAAFGALALVAPGLSDEALEGPIALTTIDHAGPVRYGADALTVLALDLAGDDVVVWRPTPGTSEGVNARFGYPMGRIGPSEGETRRLGPGSGRRMLSLWRVALAVELAGTMRAALDKTVDYVTHRFQFGQPIGSFQAVQHRLAEATVSAEGARWLALEAAWLGAPEEASAAAIVHGADAARRVAAETHQLTGAIGLTTEYGLNLWTMRLAALAIEAGWMAPTDADLVAARWNS
ncbi:MAG: acyl-CoA dehydrogenase family protein [Acidimicrobiales bacterium]